MEIVQKYTRNEVIAETCDAVVYDFRKIADYIEKYQCDWLYVVEWLREMADEHEAQAMVVRLRDSLSTKNN